MLLDMCRNMPRMGNNWVPKGCLRPKVALTYKRLDHNHKRIVPVV